MCAEGASAKFDGYQFLKGCELGEDSEFIQFSYDKWEDPAENMGAFETHKHHAVTGILQP